MLPTLTHSDVLALRRSLFAESFKDFHYYMNPALKQCWWVDDVCDELMVWYYSKLAGERPVLVIEAPPQHGKSATVTSFITWLAAHEPTWRTIYASFSERLGKRANTTVQRVMSSARYVELYGELLPPRGYGTAFGERNQSYVEWSGHTGTFRNTTVEGSITGEGLDVGIIDDPMKGRKEANSQTKRDSTWDWLNDDFSTRFADDAGVLVIMTRWHPDDPVGRMAEQWPNVRVLTYPALALPDARLMPHDPRRRGSGEALMPFHKSREFIENKRKSMRSVNFGALYQQAPQLAGGTMFAVDMFKIVERAPAIVGRWVRFWDKAATEDGGCNTAGVRMAKTIDGQYVISDCVAGQWSSAKRERTMRTVAEMDGKDTVIVHEQEPGSGGKESAENTTKNLAGFKVKAHRATGDKVVRAEPYAAQVEHGNVLLVRGEWNKAFIDEHEAAPHGALKDRWDAAAGAFNYITATKKTAGAA